MTDKLFRGETSPPLTITFDTSVLDYDSVILRFFEPRHEDAPLLDVAVEVESENGLSGTAQLSDTDLAEFADQVYNCLPIGIKNGKETALFETPVKFLVRTLPTNQDVS